MGAPNFSTSSILPPASLAWRRMRKRSSTGATPHVVACLHSSCSPVQITGGCIVERSHMLQRFHCCQWAEWETTSKWGTSSRESTREPRQVSPLREFGPCAATFSGNCRHVSLSYAIWHLIQHICVHHHDMYEKMNLRCSQLVWFQIKQRLMSS